MLKSKYTWSTKVEGIIPNKDIYKVILQNRGIDDPDHFFTMGKEVLHDPFLLSGMDKAVLRIHKAIELQEKIVIYGDYDCDGITAISVLMRALRKLNANVSYDLPDRFVDGYGLNMRAAKALVDQQVKLVITVDNGITCDKEVDYLNQNGVDTIITDHHEVKEVIPNAYQIIHPKLSPLYPFKEIAGVMVAYKLAVALSNDLLDELFDLVMIGTIADLMPLENENQAMVNLGLIQLQNTVNLGLQKIIDFSHLDLINETAIAFKIAPKINSSGRLGKAKEAVSLLISDVEKEVNNLILQIEENHANRKDLTEEAFLLCEKLVEPIEDVLVISSPLLHEGVIGISAQKIAEKYQKSTVVITIDEEGTGKGSMRSFGGENILLMLEENKEYLVRFGGHSQAAGLQIEQKNIDSFKEGLQKFSTHSTSPKIVTDMRVSILDLEVGTVKKLSDNSFFTALFLFENLYITKKQKMTDKHTKFILETNSKTIEALHFNSLEYFYQLEVGDKVSLIGGLNINQWRDRQTIQIMIKDMKCDDFQLLDLRDDTAFLNGRGWIKNANLVINDKILITNELNNLIKEQKPNTVLLTPKVMDSALSLAYNKETYRLVYKILPDKRKITLYEIEKKSKLPLYVIHKIIQAFIELNFISVFEDGYLKSEAAKKTELSLSPTYQQIESIYKLENWLYSDSITNIKKAMKAWMEE